MQAEERQAVSVDAPQRYDYFRLLHVLRAAGAAPRARNDTTLAFPGSDIAEADGDSVRPAFMGLLGAAGTLPYHYTERIAASADAGPREFVGMLSVRALEQFDLAWHKQRPSRDELLQMLMSLGGGCDPALAQHAALTRRATVPADYMGRALGEYLGVAVRVEQFVGGWLPLAPRDCNGLGACNNVLGRDGALGGRQWRCDWRLRVHVGPLEGGVYRDFLPRGTGAEALAKMVGGILRGCEGPGAAALSGGDAHGGARSYYGGLAVEICVALRTEDVRGLSLGDGARLGYNAFVLSGQCKAPRSELRYQL